MQLSNHPMYLLCTYSLCVVGRCIMHMLLQTIVPRTKQVLAAPQCQGNNMADALLKRKGFPPTNKPDALPTAAP